MDRKVIIGLGNPGKEYQLTRHNIGFIIIDLYARKNNLDFVYEYDSLIGKKIINNKEIILAKPQTYMNLSGIAVKKLVGAFSISLEELLIIIDDVNLPFGKIRFRPRGSHGGHNGLLSIIQHLNTDAFPRLRIGIGKPPQNMDMKTYVLMNFIDEEVIQLKEKIIPDILNALEVYIHSGLNMAMNKFN